MLVNISKKIFFTFLIILSITVTACKDSNDTKTFDINTETNLIDQIDEITDEQLICNVGGVKIWIMNVLFDEEYFGEEPCWVITCYLENNSGFSLHTQFNNTSVNETGYKVNFNGINTEGDLDDGQKGIFHLHAFASELELYGINSITSIQGKVWIIDNNSFEMVVDDEPFNVIIDEVGNAKNAIVNNMTTEKNSYVVDNGKNNLICEVNGCFAKGTNQFMSLDRTYEYYCDKHYNEIMEAIGEMEQDVGNGSASKHKCEECSKEGTYQIEGLGGIEYYCTEHYEKLKELLSSFVQ